MGSTGTHIERGQKMANVALSELGQDYSVLKHVTKRTSGEWQYALYAAVQRGDEIFGLVVLMHRNPSPSVYWNFHYKYVDETMGPYEDECPREVFDLLTPTDNEHANDWRGRVRLNLERPKEAPLKAGVAVHFEPSLFFSDKVECSDFTFVRRNLFRRNDNTVVRIPNWRARGGKVVAA